jgi:sec-independent protein translocase protein TatA
VFAGLDNPTHWLFIAIVALIVFGPKRLPELGRSVGSGLRGFRDSLSGEPDSRAGDGEPAVVEPAPEAAAPASADRDAAEAAAAGGGPRGD